MRALYLKLALSLVLAAVIFNLVAPYFPWYAEVLKSCIANVILYPVAIIFPTGLKRYLLSSATIGAGFNGLIYLGINFPTIWQVASSNLLASSLTPASMDCPPGYIISANVSHEPSSNGCGADNIKIDKQYLPYEDQEACCLSHDICYDTCHTTENGKTRTRCDLDFKNCLDNICTMKDWKRNLVCPFGWLLPGHWFWDPYCEESLRVDLEKKCKAAVDVLYKFVDGLGSSAFISAQRVACICVPEDQESRAGLSLLVALVFGLLVAVLLGIFLFLLAKRLIVPSNL